MDSVDFGTLYARYARDVQRFALGLTGNATDAEDVTSETFVRAWTTREEIRVGTVKAYLFTIARNLCRGLQRDRRATLDASPETPDRAPGPLQQAGARNELARVLARLARLSEIDRAALLMRVQGELPYEAIAAALGLSVVAVRVKVHRARLSLVALEESEGTHVRHP